MTSSFQPGPFAILLELGIVDPADQQRILAHPDRAELFGYLALDDYVVWLVQRGLLSEARLEQGRARIADTAQGYQHLPLIERAQHKLLVLEARASHAVFDTLVEEGMLTADERDDALIVAMEDEVIASPGAALAWMVAEAGMTPRRFEAIRAAKGGSARRAAIVAEADALLSQAEQDAREAVARTAAARARRRRIAALLAALGAAIWLWRVQGPDPAPRQAALAAPHCDDAALVRTINRSLAARPPAHDGLSIAMSRGKPMGAPTMDRYAEVGFASETGIRGCLSRLTGGGSVQAYAYTLARDPASGRIVLDIANPSMVQARYGHLDAAGRFIHRADPIGRAALRKAFDAAADQITGGMLDPNAIAQLRRMVDRKARHAAQDPAPEQVRRIVDIEPVAPCRDLGGGNRYSCRLLFEYNDPVSIVVGGGTNIREGAFTVERDGAGGAWRMGGDFSTELGLAASSAPPKPPAPP